jgi:hypothetical protein
MKNLNKNKYTIYRYSFARLNEAIANRFFFEAILIEYAIIEDRINSIFRRLGFLNESGNLPEGKRKLLIRTFHKQTFRWNDISNKIKLIETLITLDSFSIPNFEDKTYLFELSLKIKSFNNEIQQIIIHLLPWLKIRNRYVHALMEYKTTSLENDLKAFVTQGKIVIRLLDSFVKKI